MSPAASTSGLRPQKRRSPGFWPGLRRQLLTVAEFDHLVTLLSTTSVRSFAVPAKPIQRPHVCRKLNLVHVAIQQVDLEVLQRFPDLRYVTSVPPRDRPVSKENYSPPNRDGPAVDCINKPLVVGEMVRHLFDQTIADDPPTPGHRQPVDHQWSCSMIHQSNLDLVLKVRIGDFWKRPHRQPIVRSLS